MNSATAKAECACDHEGLKYMYTGNELASHIPSVARNAHRSEKYFRAIRNEKYKPRKPAKAVTSAIVYRYGRENPSAGIFPPKWSIARTAAFVTKRNGIQSSAGPMLK